MQGGNHNSQIPEEPEYHVYHDIPDNHLEYSDADLTQSAEEKYRQSANNSEGGQESEHDTTYSDNRQLKEVRGKESMPDEVIMEENDVYEGKDEKPKPNMNKDVIMEDNVLYEGTDEGT